MNVQLCLSRYKEDVTWVDLLDCDYIIYSKTPGDHNYISIGRDSEASTYLTHIISNYQELAEWTFFLHAHEKHWHHPTSAIQTSKINVKNLDPRMRFFSVNHKICESNDAKPIWLCSYSEAEMMPGEFSIEEHQRVMRDVYGDDEYAQIVAQFFSDVGFVNRQLFPVSAQFCVHRSRISRRPKSFYEKCLSLLADSDSLLARKARNYNRTVGGFFFEANWHYIFGEEWIYKPILNYYDDYFVNSNFDSKDDYLSPMMWLMSRAKN
jgi:hypothetical protein